MLNHKITTNFVLDSCNNTYICTHAHMYFLSTIVISEPDDVTVCEGRTTTFTCVMDSSISSDDVQWYRLIMDTSTTVMVDGREDGLIIVPIDNGGTFTAILYIFNAKQTGYYWVKLPSDDVCNVSLTVATSM